MNEGKKKNLIVDEESLSIYLKDVKKIDLIESDEQIRLAVQAQSGDQAARNRLIESNLRFVISIAKGYQNNISGLTMNDLISEGNIGLIRSIDKFDKSKGIKFISYAVWWIRQSILQSIYDNGNTIKLPTNKIHTISKIEKIKDSLFSKMGRYPTIDEIYNEMCRVFPDSELSQIDIETLENFNNSCISINSNVSGDTGTMTLADVISDNEKPQDEVMNNDIIRGKIYDAFNRSLTEREIEIMKSYFGFEESNMSLKKISEEIGITNERIRQIKEVATRKLRGYKHKNLRSLLKNNF